MAKKPVVQKIVIEVEGGLVQDVHASFPLEYLVIDRDTDGGDTSQLIGDVECMLSAFPGKVNPAYVEQMFKEYCES